MEKIRLIRISKNPEWKKQAAQWFHEKWRIPAAAYEESMDEAISNSTPVPEWYLAVDGDEIAGGLGVIENDFHDRKDLAPNICAVYVEEPYRCRGIAGRLLQTACNDLAEQGVDTVYLVTEHTSFYERYGWEFFCMVQCDGEAQKSRMYRHKK